VQGLPSILLSQDWSTYHRKWSRRYQKFFNETLFNRVSFLEGPNSTGMCVLPVQCIPLHSFRFNCFQTLWTELVDQIATCNWLIKSGWLHIRMLNQAQLYCSFRTELNASYSLLVSEYIVKNLSLLNSFYYVPSTKSTFRTY
jgi:hypothetical protein